MLRTALAVCLGLLLVASVVMLTGSTDSQVNETQPGEQNETIAVQAPMPSENSVADDASATPTVVDSIPVEELIAEDRDTESDTSSNAEVSLNSDPTVAEEPASTEDDTVVPTDDDATSTASEEPDATNTDESTTQPEETGPTLSEAQQTAIERVQEFQRDILDTNRSIWDYAEVGLQERRSSALLIAKLRAQGFEVNAGVANMPTSFVASYGSGKPVIGILAEYDALPGLSQKVTTQREPVNLGEPGHACGHSGLGAGAMGAAVAIKRAMEKHGLKGTIRLYGTPAEETVIGKVYMLLDGQFDDLDICLHWHPSSRNEVWSGSSKSLISAKFTFSGTAAHASVSPENGRSALDGVELMNAGVNYMREHIKDDARIHYVITNGGAAPNVVPAKATVWYYIRANQHNDAAFYFSWIRDIAKGAAIMSRTEVDINIDTDCHELIPNTPLSELLYRNLQTISPPTFTEEEHAFTRRLQLPLFEEFGTQFDLALDESIHPINISMDSNTGSTDVGDVSWYVPTGGIRATCFPAGSPGHSWQNVACIGSSIGEKGIIYATEVLAISAIQLFENPELIAEARADWEYRMQGRQYTTLIPTGQKVPASIR
ncbi:MAG: amidohydrolase [Planctomycetota bacterium]|nr:amidohydrolase [Planctomycetota bacterium]MDA1213985.1 amidohydrolase [Planctomycetota bacterium]